MIYHERRWCTMKQNVTRTVFIGLFLILSIVYLEILFKIRVLSFELNLDVWRIVLFSLSYGVLFIFFLKFFSEKVVKRLLYFVVIFVTFLESYPDRYLDIMLFKLCKRYVHGKWVKTTNCTLNIPSHLNYNKQKK